MFALLIFADLLDRDAGQVGDDRRLLAAWPKALLRPDVHGLARDADRAGSRRQTVARHLGENVRHRVARLVDHGEHVNGEPRLRGVPHGGCESLIEVHVCQSLHLTEAKRHVKGMSYCIHNRSKAK
jgi:hypothetical protein